MCFRCNHAFHDVTTIWLQLLSFLRTTLLYSFSPMEVGSPCVEEADKPVSPHQRLGLP